MKEWYNNFSKLRPDQANSKWAVWTLFAASFVDASFLPLPVSTFFLLMVLMNNSRAARYIIYCTLGTLAGAFAGFSIGHFAVLSDHGANSGFIQFLFRHIPGFSWDAFSRIQALYSKWDFWIIFSASFTPIPYGVVSISSGLFGIRLSVFLIATFISQAIKFFLLAFLTVRLGPRVKQLFRIRLNPAFIIASVCIAIVLLVTGII
jgi:membrane protein YqaA with SNARE-associated domain